MIHLFANVYLRPYELGFVDKEHMYVLKTESFGFGTGTSDTALIKPLPLENPTIKDCVEYSLNNDDLRIVVYVAPDEFKQLLSSFIKDIGLGDYNQIVDTYKEWYRENWELFYAIDATEIDKPLAFEEFESKYFSDFPSLEDAGTLECNREHLGIEWKLYEYMTGNKKVSGLKEKLMYIARGSLASELRGLKLGLEKVSNLVNQDWLELSDEGFFSKLDPLVNDENISKSAPAAEYFEKTYGLKSIPEACGKSKRNICDRVQATGKFPTYTEIIKDVTGPNNLEVFNELEERMYVNLDIIKLAKNT